MAYVAPTTRSDGYIVAASVWNQDVVENIKYFKDAPNFDGLATFDAGLAMVSGQKLYLDGIAGTGDTFLIESSGNTLQVVVGARAAFVMNATVTSHEGIFSQTGTLTVSDTVGLAPTKKLYLDGIGMTGDTHIAESVANTLALTSGGVAITIVSGVINSTLEIKAATAGTVVSSFINALNVAGFDAFGCDSTGVKTVVGGYRSSQWSQVGLYTSGSERLNIDTSGVVKFNAYTAATFVAGDKYLVVNASGVIHVSALGPAS